MDQPKKVWDWRTHVLKDGPDNATYKHLLLTLSCYMDSAGGSCFPAISTLVEVTSLTKPTVLKYLKKAREDGWIKVSKHGFKGQRWARNEYTATLPEAVKEVNHLEEKAVNELNEGGKTDSEGGKTDNERRLNSLSTTSPCTSSNNTSPENTPSIAARADVDDIFNAYPKSQKPAKAKKEIKKALEFLDSYELNGEVISDPVNWLLERVKTFANSPAGKQGQYTPHPDNWFRDQRYLEDPNEWFKNGKTGRSKSQTGNPPNAAAYRPENDYTSNSPSRTDKFFDRGEELLEMFETVNKDTEDVFAGRRAAENMTEKARRHIEQTNRIMNEDSDN